MDEANRALSELLKSRTDWDEEPALQFMYDVNGTYEIGRNVVPSGHWHPDRPPLTLQLFAQMLEMLGPEALAEVVPSSVVGVVFRYEGWGLMTQAGEESNKARAAAGRRELHIHPDKMECRVADAAMVDGTHRMAWLERETGKVQFTEPGDITDGLVPDALLAILRAMGVLKE